MLLQFSIQNFRTFKDKAILSLVASNYDKVTREVENISHDTKFNLRLLKSAVVYGANASGKSKLFEALMFMKDFVVSGSKNSQKGDLIKVEPFRLDSESETQPTEFEVIFTHDEILYRYGFEADQHKIVSEWLYYKPKNKEIELFYREGDHFETHERNFSKGAIAIKQGIVRDNALLLPYAAQNNDDTSYTVIEWFKKLITISGLNEHSYGGYSLYRTDDPAYKSRILELLSAADLGIQDIKLQKLETEVLDVFTTHKRYDADKKGFAQVQFSLDHDESSGTKKFFALTAPVLDILESGYTLLVDELDAKLHPNLVCKIVSLFNSTEFNKKNAQLIFNTHDTNLLSSGLFRRDQIWFTEKNKYGEAKLYALSDFKSDEVKKTESFEENYINGKYGGVPYLGFFDNLNSILPEYEKES
jgi:AAA15 family ATPase/GTPase